MADMSDRRASQRISSTGIVTLLIGDGQYRGSRLVAMMTDMSAGGIGVLLDGGLFTRGTALQVHCEDGLELDGWVSYCGRDENHLTKLGISFNPISKGESYEVPSSSQMMALE